jgi:hypothetical protein
MQTPPESTQVLPLLLFSMQRRNHRSADTAGGKMHTSKIGDLPLFAMVGALAVLWLVAIIGLSLTIKREYLSTFVSSQTGHAYAQSYFLDNPGNDARRTEIFFHNERQWLAIRDRVRQWVLSVYAAWKALMPAWFTMDLHGRIPDDFIPVEIVHALNAQAPGGRRLTLENMSLLQRMSLSSSAASVGVTSTSAREHMQPTSSQSTPRRAEEEADMDGIRMVEQAIAASLVEDERRHAGGEVPDCPLGMFQGLQSRPLGTNEDDDPSEEIE